MIPGQQLLVQKNLQAVNLPYVSAANRPEFIVSHLFLLSQ
jgi:hypothetical protein